MNGMNAETAGNRDAVLYVALLPYSTVTAQRCELRTVCLACMHERRVACRTLLGMHPSREHTEQFLLRNIEKLTIKTVVQQLKKIDRRSLCWYLHMIFTNCFDVYNTEEYASYHRMQISLYAEEAALSNAAKRGTHQPIVRKKLKHSQ